MVKQGEVYWVDLSYPNASEPGFLRPFVVIQNNLFNATKVSTVVGCVLTSNMNRRNIPGCVALKKGEANLNKQSVINITQLYTINKSECIELIGLLSEQRIQEIIAGINLLILPREIEE